MWINLKNTSKYLLHFEKYSYDDLHDHVEDKVTDSDVDAHVGHEPPNLPTAFRVVDQDWAVWNWAFPSDR